MACIWINYRYDKTQITIQPDMINVLHVINQDQISSNIISIYKIRYKILLSLVLLSFFKF